jgi:DNA primase large subunit
MPGNPEANRKLLEKPRNALNLARVLYATGTKKMAEYMGNNLSTVLKEMNDKHVADFALTISGELNKYLEMEMLLKQGKVKEAKAVLISLHNSKEWREFASGFTQRDIAMYAPIAIEAAKKKFIAANFGKIEKNKDRVEEAIPNYKKARSYITKVIVNLGDSKEDKAKKQAIYMNLARALYMQKQNGNKPTVDFAEEYPMMEYY